MQPIRVAILGAGLMGRWHARYAAAAGAEVAAVVDPDSDRRQHLRARHRQALGFADLDSCLAGAAFDAVHLCTPSESHVALATRALDAGKHVLAEKPLAGTHAETERLLRRAVESRVLLNPVHQFPFQQGVRSLLGSLDDLGDLVEVSFATSSAGGAGRDAASRRELLFEILPHPLSLFRAVVGSVAGVTWQVVASTDDELDLAGERNGVLLRARISLRARPTRNVLMVAGDRATAHADLFHGFSVVERGAPSRRTKLLQPFALGGKLLTAAGGNLVRRSATSELAYPGLRRLIGDFHDAVRTGSPAPIADSELLEIAEAIDRLRDGAHVSGDADTGGELA